MTFADHLARFTPEEWTEALETLAPEIHPIDLDATRVWLAFFPLQLHLALMAASPEERPALERKLGLMGQWRLEDHVDTSHTFLHGHRYWPQTRRAILAVSAETSFPATLPEIFTRVADHVSRTCSVDRDQLLGITIAGLMTLRQCGGEKFGIDKLGIDKLGAAVRVQLTPEVHARSIRQIQRRRRLQRGQGLFGFLRGRKKRYRMTFDENAPDGSFELIAGQDIASGAQSDKRDYRAKDSRCIPGEGPIPVECRAASCGTCWVGVLAGADRLSPIDPADEGKRLKVFGYPQPRTNDGAPIIRLACQARPTGDVTFVIPPWNGIIGKII
ncbi:MAG: (2Fe-2S)-binding protein [Acidobacteria bacterium]|nr:MAG: (2Fe-2S)-binding protein [Acidobacteriota bacterium]